MSSILRRGLDYFTPSPSPKPTDPRNKDPSILSVDPGANNKTIFATAATSNSLFTSVDKTVDGDDCDHDCASCTVKYPSKFIVDYEDELYGHVNGWATHVLVATGKTDWVRDVADEKGSVMEAIDRGGVSPSNGALKLSASNIPVPDEYHEYPEGQQPTTVLLLPAFTVIEHVTPALVPELIKNFIDHAPTTTSPLTGGLNEAAKKYEESEEDPAVPPVPALSSPIGTPAEEASATVTNFNLTDLAQSLPHTSTTSALRSHPCPHAAVILLCSQRTRDARCGQSAPLLRKEFERHLRPLGLYRDLHDERPGGVGIYFISHVGGHKYSANVIVYRRRDFEWYRKRKEGGDRGTARGNDEGVEEDEGCEGEKEGASQGIWLARVRPEDCEGIIKFTVLQGKVVKPGLQLRGGFDRERGLVSW